MKYKIGDEVYYIYEFMYGVEILKDKIYDIEGNYYLFYINEHLMPDRVKENKVAINKSDLYLIAFEHQLGWIRMFEHELAEESKLERPVLEPGETDKLIYWQMLIDTAKKKLKEFDCEVPIDFVKK